MKRFWIQLMAWLPLTDASVIIADGKATVRRGNVRSVLLSELEELARSSGLDLGCIRAQTRGNGFRLSFYGVPPQLRQRFRNVWGANWR